MDEKLAHKPGARLGAYEIVRLIGHGGMAFIYEARNTALGKRVAIKVLYEYLAASPVAAARFEREGRAASRIRHPNVVETFEVGRQDGAPYLVMELLEGTDLAEHLAACGALPVAEAVDILLPAISGVAAAHAAGVVHRDLKPSNVYLAQERRSGVCPKVVDFGISKFPLDGEHGLTATEMLLGTAEYMAPEHARSPKNADARSDQYALGAILYECITGRRPFEGDSTYDLLHAIVTAPLPSPRSFVQDLDPALEAAIVRAMSREPSQRYDSVEAFGHAIVPFASHAMRTWWWNEFEASKVGRPSSSVRASGGAQIVSLLATTLPDSRPTARSARPPPIKWLPRAAIALVLVVAVSLATRLPALRGAARESAQGAPAAAETVAREPRTETPLGRDSLVESVVDPNLPRAVPPTSGNGLARPAQRATGTRTEPPSNADASTASPLPQPSSRPVERGYNGAPIIE